MQFEQLRRRELIMLIGGMAAAWSLAARAQQLAVPMIGFLSSGSPGGPWADFAVAFRAGLAEIGYTDGQNVAVDYRWAENQNDRLPALANELVRARVSVIVAGGPPAALAAK